MDIKNYISDYIEQSKIEMLKDENPDWVKPFFKVFSEELEKRRKNASPGDRNTVSGSFSKAFQELIPTGLKWRPEVPLNMLLQIDGSSECNKVLMKKRIDFVVYCNQKTILIEFKTNLQFNDLAAAMVEMGLVKKYNPLPSIKSIRTSSMHLFPFTTNIKGLKEINEKFDSPLNEIWIFCKEGTEIRFDVHELKRFRGELLKFNGV